MPRTKEECRSMMQSIISMHENGAVADPKASAKLAKRGDADDLERRLLHKKSCWLDLEAVADVEDATLKMDEAPPLRMTFFLIFSLRNNNNHTARRPFLPLGASLPAPATIFTISNP
ncbi:hypothetical protein CYMTET_49770 [Cymbomonas tetramitiformis]|uniref:Uncharacterized protein n=1 Tax=Cymbomonas tetramitiformis TaxID=36881 RepID=A0AAE0BQQ2_9CHLO|nr:hypothetical protein CYMTET_49770 [Cymbomonas tetramitiformis]